ncbi:LLM class flavin-dependent oxidoreductase [Acidianus sp.]|uniref:LLM class flavin-dependent oxidoreductase n=1 Tax=Acidianus sp. TaxID=1872104 RepID=UPI00397C136F
MLGALRRHPAVLAQEAATLARLSGRRVVLGLGVGARRQDVSARHMEARGRGLPLGVRWALRAFWAGGRSRSAGGTSRSRERRPPWAPLWDTGAHRGLLGGFQARGPRPIGGSWAAT